MADVGTRPRGFVERLEDLLWPLTVALVLIAPTQYSYAMHPKDGPFVLYADLYAAALFGLWLLVTLLGRRWHAIIRPPGAIWAVIAVAALSALGATSMRSAAVEIAQLGLYFIAVYALFADVLRGQHRIVVAAKALAIATTVVVFVALYQYFTTADAMQVRGTFGNRNVYGAYLVMVLPLLFGIAIWTRDSLHRAWFLFVVALGALTMLAGIQFWCLALILLVLCALKSLRAVGYYLLGTVLLVTIIVMWLPRDRSAIFTEVADPVERRAAFKEVEGFAPDVLIQKRWLEWRAALLMLADNPPLGVGVGNYQLHIGESTYWGYVPNARKIEPDTNNLYLVIASSMGLIGLVAFMAWLGHFWRLAETNWRRARDDWSMGVSWGLLGATYGILLVNLFSSLFVRGTSLVWALIFAMIASVHLRGFRGQDVTAQETGGTSESRGED